MPSACFCFNFTFVTCGWNPPRNLRKEQKKVPACALASYIYSVGLLALCKLACARYVLTGHL